MTLEGKRRSAGENGLWIVTWLLVAFLLAPILVIVAVSFNNAAYLTFPPTSLSLRWYREFFGSARWISSSLLSVQIAVAVTVASSILGTLAAVGVVRSRNRAKRSLETFLVSPLVTPSIVFAVGLYFLFSPLHLINTATGIVVGHIVVATPLVFITVAGALRTINPSLEMAGRSLGAGPFRCLWRVTLPMIKPAIAAGAAFAFLTSFDEVVIAIFIGGPQATTLPKRMWDGVRFETDPTLTAIASLLVLLTIVVLVSVGASRRLLSPGRTRPNTDGGN